MANRIMWIVIIAIVFILGFGAWDIRNNNIKSIASGQAHASIFTDAWDAITGHVDDVVDRQKDDEFINGEIIKQSTFEFTKDSIHWAEGSVEIIKNKDGYFIQLGKDFEAGLAPDLYIFTSKNKIVNQEDVNNASKDNLKKLVKGSGASYYYIPSKDIKSIVIWCKQFNQFMGSAHV